MNAMIVNLSRVLKLLSCKLGLELLRNSPKLTKNSFKDESSKPFVLNVK